MFKIAFCGPPSSGKTTVAEGLSHHYKQKGKYKRVELVVEYAREFVIRFGSTNPADQLHILHEQIKKEGAADGSDFMFTDSAFWLSYIYACHHGNGKDAKDQYYINAIHNLMLPRLHDYDFIFYLPAHKELGANFDDGQRIHTNEEDIAAIDRKIKGFMELYNIEHHKIMDSPSKRIQCICDIIDNKKREQKKSKNKND